MSIRAAVRAACLADVRVRALLRAPDAVYADGVAPPDDPGPLVVIGWVDGDPLDDQDGLDGARRARLQIDAWASGVGAAELVTELGHLLERALGGLADAQYGRTVVQSGRIVQGSERHERDDELATERDPPWVFGFDCEFFFHEEA